MAETEAADSQPEVPASDATVEVQEAELPEVPDVKSARAGGQIDVLLDSTLPVEAHLGQVEAQVRELLHLGPGSVLKLDKEVGEPIDLFLRGVRFATGQLVVVGDRLGVKIREVIPPEPAEEPA